MLHAHLQLTLVQIDHSYHRINLYATNTNPPLPAMGRSALQNTFYLSQISLYRRPPQTPRPIFQEDLHTALPLNDPSFRFLGLATQITDAIVLVYYVRNVRTPAQRKQKAEVKYNPCCSVAIR